VVANLEVSMLRTLIRLEHALRHYVAGSAYLLVHFATHERRTRGLLPAEVESPVGLAGRRESVRGPGLAKAKARSPENVRTAELA
jgi:hypothetical protein